jgi:hypothetical protein
MTWLLGFLKYIHVAEMINLKICWESRWSCYTNLKLFKVYLKFTWRSEFLFGFEYMLQSWVVANLKSSNYLASNGNPHEPSMRNLLNPFRIEGLVYLRVLALFFYVWVFMYCTLLILKLYPQEIRGKTFYL